MEPSHRQLRRRRVDDRASAAVSDAPTPLMRPTGTHIQRFEHAPLSGADLGYFFSFFLIKKEKVSPPTVESHAPPDPARPPATLPRRTVRKTGIPSALVPFRTQNAHGAENGVFHRSVVMQDLRNSIFASGPKASIHSSPKDKGIHGLGRCRLCLLRKLRRPASAFAENVLFLRSDGKRA